MGVIVQKTLQQIIKKKILHKRVKKKMPHNSTLARGGVWGR